MKRIPRIFNYVFNKNRWNLEIDIIMADISIIQFIFNLHLSSIRGKQFLSRLFIEFSHTQDIINNVTWDFPVTSHSTIKSATQVKAQVLTYPFVQAFMPRLTIFAKLSAKSKKKKSTFNGLSKTALISWIEQSWKNKGEVANAHCRHCILYPLRLGLSFPNDVQILRHKVGLVPNQMLNWLERC